MITFQSKPANQSDRNQSPISDMQLLSEPNKELFCTRVFGVDQEASEELRIFALGTSCRSFLARLTKAFATYSTKDYDESSGDIIVDLSMSQYVGSESLERNQGQRATYLISPSSYKDEVGKRRFFPAADRPLLEMVASLSKEGLQQIGLLPPNKFAVNDDPVYVNGHMARRERSRELIRGSFTIRDAAELAQIISEGKDFYTGSVGDSISELDYSSADDSREY